MVNVKDAYEDSRFNKKFDASSGFVTKQVLAAPIFDANDGSVVGVLQAINCIDPAKKDKGFCEDNEALVVKLNKQLGVAIGRCLMYELEHAKEEKLIEDERKMIEDLEQANKVEQDEIVRLEGELQDMTKAKEALDLDLKQVTGTAKNLEAMLSKAIEENEAMEADLKCKSVEHDDEISRLKAELENEKRRAGEFKKEKNILAKKVHMEELLDRVSSTLASDLKMKSLFEQVCVHACDLMEADRATLFLVDKEKSELWSLVAHGEEHIRIPLSTGVAGHSACTGAKVNITDVYKDVRFNRSVDLKTGYVTKTILASPVFDHTGLITGVLQVINKKGDVGVFTGADEETLSKLNTKVSAAVAKCLRVKEMEDRFSKKLKEEHDKEHELEERLKQELAKEEELKRKLKAKSEQLEEEKRRESQLERDLMDERDLADVSEALANDLEVVNLFDQVCDHACRLMGADRATLFLIDHDKPDELYSKIAHGSAEIRVNVGVGIAGYVAASGEMVNIPDAYRDSRFNRENDHKTGYKTSTILCAPLFEASGAIVGVLQIINKENGRFTIRDEGALRKLGR